MVMKNRKINIGYLEYDFNTLYRPLLTITVKNLQRNYRIESMKEKLYKYEEKYNTKITSDKRLYKNANLTKLLTLFLIKYLQ